MREIVLDTETTGLNIEDGHRIIEIAACEMKNYVLTGERLHLYINPERKIDEVASSVHGITNDDLIGKPKFTDIYEKFLEFVSNDRLIIHNAEFDMSFLNNELKICGVNPLKNDILDTLKLARTKHPGSLVNLDSLCRRFNISLENRDYHGALVDTLLLADVYVELIGGRQTTLIFNKNDNIDNSNHQRTNLKTKQLEKKLEIRNFEPDEGELKKHKNFIKDISNSIWNKYT
tara:strand:+ start:4307 stop:5002 length:696 start_codon:yes stop_codon:yes gene_type:complete